MTTALRPDTLAARGLTLVALQHPEFIENPEFVAGGGQKRWIRSKGASLKEGNYRLFYGDGNGKPFTNLAGAPLRVLPLAPSEKLVLQVGDRRYRIDVSGVPNGGAIGEARLHKFLDCVTFLRAWGRDVECRLILRRNETDVLPSDPVMVKTPVAPWTQALDPDLFTHDPTIQYCGDLERKIFKGRILKRYAGRLFFTFKDCLETDVKMRGFACIGLVGNLYGIPPGAAYEKGEAMAVALGGTAFDWAGRPKVPPKAFRAQDSTFDKPDSDGADGTDFVRMSRELLLNFMASAEARAGTYMIWTGGHAGLIRNGVLYECKPSGKGFTKETYTPGVQSAVRRFDGSQLATQLKDGPYFLSKLPG